MSKTKKDRDPFFQTYRMERQPRTKKRRIETEREREVEIPSRQSLIGWEPEDVEEDS